MASGREGDVNSRDNSVSESLLSSFSSVVLWRTILMWFIMDHQPQGMKGTACTKDCLTEQPGGGRIVRFRARRTRV